MLPPLCNECGTRPHTQTHNRTWQFLFRILSYMHLIKHVFFLQNIAKAIEESPLPPKTMINFGFQKDTCRGRRRIFQNFGRRSEKVKTKLAFSNPLFYPCIGGEGGIPVWLWGSGEAK